MIQRRFNVGVLEASPKRKASALCVFVPRDDRSSKTEWNTIEIRGFKKLGMSHPFPPRYIKYTIVESHEYPAKVISVLPWRQQAALFLGFFQMAGFNRYAVDGERRLYVDLLEDLDGGTYESSRAGWLGAAVDLSGVASRDILRKEWRKEDLKAVPSSAGAADLLPNVAAPWLPSLEADMPLEYLPFSVAKLGFPNATCDAVLGTRAGQFWPGFCGVAVQRARSCDCWINLPTFKSRTFVADLLAKVASLLKVPSRVTTYLEMALGSTNPARAHVTPVAAGWKDRAGKMVARRARDHADGLKPIAATLASASLDVYTCGGAKHQTSDVLEPCDAAPFAFDAADTVVHFSGRPPAPAELKSALAQMA